MRKVTSLSPICDRNNARCVGCENIRKIAAFRTFSLVTQRVLIESQIGKREEILRMILHKLCMHHFAVQ